MAYSTKESFFAYDSFNTTTCGLINQSLSSSQPGMLKTYDSLMNMDAKAWNISNFIVSKYLASIVRCPMEQRNNEIVAEDTNPCDNSNDPIDTMMDDYQQLKNMLDEKNLEIVELTQIYQKVKNDYEELFADARDRIDAIQHKPRVNIVERNVASVQTEIDFIELKQDNETLLQRTDELNALMQQFTEAQENVKDFDSCLAERDMLRNKLEYATKSQANESSRLAAEIINLQAEISEMQRKENELIKQHEQLLGENEKNMQDNLRIECAEREAAQSQNSIKAYLQQIESLQNEIQQKNDLLSAAQNHIGVIENELNVLDEKCESQSINNEIFAEQHQKNQNLLKGMQQAIQFAMMLLLEGTRITTHLRNEICNLKNQLNARVLCDISTSTTEAHLNYEESEIKELRLKIQLLEEEILRKDKQVEILQQTDMNSGFARANDGNIAIACTEDANEINGRIFDRYKSDESEPVSISNRIINDDISDISQEPKCIWIEVDEIYETEETESFVSMSTQSNGTHASIEGDKRKPDAFERSSLVDESESNTERKRLTDELRAVIENLVNNIELKKLVDFETQTDSRDCMSADVNCEPYTIPLIDKKLVADQIISVIEKLIKKTELNVFESDGDESSFLGYSTDDESIAVDEKIKSLNRAVNDTADTTDVSMVDNSQTIVSSKETEWQTDNTKFNLNAHHDTVSYFDQSTSFDNCKFPSQNLYLKVDNETQMSPKSQSVGTQYLSENVHSIVDHKDQSSNTSNVKASTDGSSMKEDSQAISSELKSVIENLVINMESVSLSADNPHDNDKWEANDSTEELDDKTILATHLRAVIEEVIDSAKQKQRKENMDRNIREKQSIKIDKLIKENNDLQSMVHRLNDQLTMQNDAEKSRTNNYSLLMNENRGLKDRINELVQKNRLLSHEISEKKEKWTYESEENEGYRKGIILLRNENNSLRTKLSSMKDKIKANTRKHPSGQSEATGCICILNLYSNTKENGSAFDTAELNKICRKIIEMSVFALTMAELQYVHNAIYIAAIEKDPFRKATTMLGTYDLNGHKDRMEYLETELAETTKRLKIYMKPRPQWNRPQKI